MSTPNKYTPHQGKREKTRRAKQITSGVISQKQVVTLKKGKVVV